MYPQTLIVAILIGLSVVTPAAADDIVDGRTASGALYRLVRPTNWNGSLVLYAHGLVSSRAPVTLPAEGGLIVGLLAPQGFAVAFSSYSENGWTVRDGAERTHDLLRIFSKQFDEPTRVYLAGASMGGLIAIKLAERYPGTYAGVIPACAVAGGSRRHFDYLGHVRALFDHFYPGVLPGSAAGVPADIDITQAILGPAIAAMMQNPAGALAIASIEQTPIPFASADELVQSIATSLALHADSINDVLAHTHGHDVFSNQATRYTGALPAALLGSINFGVQRFDASPAALEYLERYYQPNGELRVPMMMLSTSRDPVVPDFHQESYARDLMHAGTRSYLVQRVVTRYGHCNFTPEELGSTFTDLVLWVEFGVRPTP